MIAEQIQCTDAELRIGYHQLGLVAEPPAAVPSFATCDLVDGNGALTTTARAVLPLLARPPRIITVSAVTAGDAEVALATIIAPIGEGPFVARSDRDGTVDLAVLDSPSAVVTLLDRMMLVRSAPVTTTPRAIELAPGGWLGLLAAADTVRAATMRQLLARSNQRDVTFTPDGLAESIDQALGTTDSRWALGATAMIDRATLGSGSPTDLASSLVHHSLAAPVDGGYQLTELGESWAAAIGAATRISHVRVVDVVDDEPVDVFRLTCLRSPTAILTAETSTAVTVLARSDPEVVIALLSAALASGDGSLDASAVESEAETAPSAATVWVYVLEPVHVRGLHDTTTVAGTLQPKVWYRAGRTEGANTLVSDVDRTFEGWAPTAALHQQE